MGACAWRWAGPRLEEKLVVPNRLGDIVGKAEQMMSAGRFNGVAECSEWAKNGKAGLDGGIEAQWKGL